METRLLNLRAKIFRALSAAERLEILEFLHNGEKCVCEIVPHMGVAQPVVSRHLKILKDSGVVTFRKDGTRRLYSITDPRIFRIINALNPELINTLTQRMIDQMA